MCISRFIILETILLSKNHYRDCECVIAGDFNTVMGSSDAVALRLNDFVASCSLVRCDDFYVLAKKT